MAMAVKTIPAGEFKAQCMALLDEIALTRKQIVITKRGKPVAKIVPIDEQEPASLLASVLWEKDLVSPIDEDRNTG